LGRGGSIAKHVSASSSLDSSVARIASELSKYHRLDLARLVAMREHNLQQVQEEVQALKAMIDPAEDEKRIAAISRNDEPVKRQQHVVIPMVLHMTWKSKTDLPRNAKKQFGCLAGKESRPKDCAV
jgi:mannosyltransferase OCH1-like enzyme